MKERPLRCAWRPRWDVDSGSDEQEHYEC